MNVTWSYEVVSLPVMFSFVPVTIPVTIPLKMPAAFVVLLAVL